MTLQSVPKNTELPALSPIVAPWVQQMLEQPELIRDQMMEYGSPLNIHCRQPFIENYREYRSVFEKHGLDHLVCFARKANKSSTFVAAAREEGFGVDTASYRELQECLELGCDPGRLVYTAAIKDQRSVNLAVRAGVVIILDNEDEWQLVLNTAEALNKKARVGVRISGFHVDGKKLYSRFGFDIDGAAEKIIDLFTPEEYRRRLEFCGLHFHLDGYSTRQRGIAFHDALDLALELQQQQLDTRFVDIGGGFLINYLKNEAEYERFDTQLRAALQGHRSPITFNNDGLGYRMVNGELQGKLNVYPYFNNKARSVFLEEILSVVNESGVSVSARARSIGLEVRMEPGRSLLDQSGITVARVAHRKRDSRGDLLIGLEMNMTQMHSSSADFLLDPIVLFQHEQPDARKTEGYFTGAYCLERDVLLKRKITLKQMPEIGDLVVFPNTAGYMMHFFESEAHLFELAANLVYDVQHRSLVPDGYGEK